MKQLALSLKSLFLYSMSIGMTLSLSAHTAIPTKILYPHYTSREELCDLYPKTPEDMSNLSNYTRATITRLHQTFISVLAKDRTQQNTLDIYDQAYAHYLHTAGVLNVVDKLSQDAALRDAAKKELVTLSAFWIDTFSSREYYQALLDYQQNGQDIATLSKEHTYVLEELLKECVLGGLHLPDEKLAIVNDLKKKNQKLGITFISNISADASYITVPYEGLAGLESEFITQLKRTDDGLYILGVDYPTYFMVMDYCSVSSTRQALWAAFNNRAYETNHDILNELMTQRRTLAQELGFESYAHLNLANQMVKTPERAETFVREVWEKVTPIAQEEFAQFCNILPEGVVASSDGKLSPWDTAYVKAHYKKHHFTLDERKIAEYFPLSHTIDALLDVYAQFFGLRLEVSPITGLWADDLKIVEVFRPSDNQLLGSIILDLHPRPNKYSHACHVRFVPALQLHNDATNENLRLPSAAVVIANFPKPTLETPALLKHSDVETFFHEFGHGMHAILGATHTALCSGTNVKTDFVELPSQVFERWLWDPVILKKVSSHYQTGEPLPDHMINSMISTQYFDAGIFYERQCALAFLALALFGPEEQKDCDDVLAEIWQQYISGTIFDARNHMITSFVHLAGYGARYYGYLWSNVFAYDVFTRVQREGLLNPQAGKRLIDAILSRGGSADPDELLLNYLARKPQIDAFLQSIATAN